METLLHYPQDLLLGTIGLLDSLPDSIRAVLAATILALLLGVFERRIPTHETQYGQSYRKAALVVLLLIPLFVWLFPASRMIVFVEELTPGAGSRHWFWTALLGIWSVGFAVAVLALARAYRRERREKAQLIIVEDEKVLARLNHWQRRLGMNTPFTVLAIPGDRPRFLFPATSVAIPKAALHWPGALQDILLITALAHVKQRHRRWHLFGQLVCCAYWPLPWIQSLHNNLLRDFQQSADELAGSCYQDRIGYNTALRQLEARMKPSKRGPTHDTGQQQGLIARSQRALDHYATQMRRLISPVIEPRWQLEALVAVRSSEVKLLWRDPYDKVVLFVGQAVFLAFLLTGVTLRERPPEIDYEYSMPFELLWKEHFHRSLELQEKTQPAAN